MLTPRPFRGDQVAAGVVALTVLVALVLVRVGDDLGEVGRVLVAGAACTFVTALGARTVTEPDSPRGYQVALFVCSWVLGAILLVTLVDAVDADPSAAGTFLAVAAALTAHATWWSRDRDSSTMTLLASLAGIVAVLALGELLLDPGAEGYRWLLAGCAAALGLSALARRDHRPFHAAQLANAGGLAIAAILATSALGLAFSELSPFAPDVAAIDEAALGAGWELVGAGVGFGLVGYGAIDRHRGPVLVGTLVLVLWVLTVGADGGLLGWPLVLALGAGFLLVVGLRPTTPLPPPPDDDEIEAPVHRLAEREPEL